MKTTVLLLATCLLAGSTFSQKKAYKYDQYQVRLRYNTLPALTELSSSKSYSITMTDAAGAPVTFGNASQRAEIETSTYIPGMRQVDNGGDFHVEVITKNLNRTKVEQHQTTSTSTPAVTTMRYHLLYEIAYQLKVTDNKTQTVVMDTVIRASGFTKYPGDYGKSEPSTLQQLEKMYQVDQNNVEFVNRANHLSARNAAGSDLKKQLASLLTIDWSNLNLAFASLKTKDPAFASLDSAQTDVEAAFKIMNKNHLDGIKINWHTDEVQRLLSNAHRIYSGYFENGEIDDPAVKDEFMTGLVVNIYYLDVMLGRYDDAQNLMYASKDAVWLQNYKKEQKELKEGEQRPSTVRGVINSIKPTESQKLQFSMQVMEPILVHESKYHKKHGAFYGYN